MHTNGKNPAPAIWALLLVPVGAFAIALADTRLGFSLFMGSVGVTMLVLVLALYFRNRSLRTGEIRIAESGDLVFLPSTAIFVGSISVALAMFVPGVVSLMIAILELPMQQGLTRFTALAPYALALFGAWSVLQLLLATRVPQGLRVSPEGLEGARGTRRVSLLWDDLVAVSAFGSHGAKLVIHTRNHGPLVLDCHYLGSDPAVIAQVIEYFRVNRAQRMELTDGPRAIRLVENTTQ